MAATDFVTEEGLQDAMLTVAADVKALALLLNNNATDLSALTTTAKTNFVAAVNELVSEIAALSGGGSAESLDDLTDVTLTSPVSGNILRHNGTVWVNTPGTDHYQPLDSDLTSIAALTTTSYGRALLTLADAAALMALLSSATTTAAGIVELATNAEALTGTDTQRAVTPAALQAKIDALVGDAPGLLDTLGEISNAIADNEDFAGAMTTALAGKQGLDATLTALAGVTVAANQMLYSTAADTFAVTALTSFARSLLDDADAATARATLGIVASSADFGAYYTAARA